MQPPSAAMAAFDSDRVLARIVSSDNGGPLRTIINGGGKRPTGRFVSVKGQSHAMPWESEPCELAALQLAEAGSPVFDLLAQPHRLEINSRRHSRPLVYFPDLLLNVDQAFAAKVASGVPFGRAVLEWQPVEGRAEARTLIVEVKDDRDRRRFDADYSDKLAMAGEVYRRIGYLFVELVRSRDLECIDMGPVRDVVMDRYTSLCTTDVDCVRRRLHSLGGRAPERLLIDDLGGGAVGSGKLAALHVRRFVRIDLRLRASSARTVQWIGDDRAIWHGGR